jgi:simple sugar transport system permease protein
MTLSRRHLPLLVTIGLFIAGYAVCASQFPAMLSLRVMLNLLSDNAFLGILAVGMTVVIVSGGIDLSVGSVMAFSAVLLAVLIGGGMPAPVAFVLVLVAGSAFGALMGAAIQYLKAPAFIVTLTGLFLARGGCFLLTTESVAINDPVYTAITSGGLALPGGAHLSVGAMVMIAVFIVGGVLLHGTRFGTNVFAIGGDARAAARMGAPVARTTIGIYAFSGAMAALAGIVFSLYTGAGYPLAAMGIELDAIAAVVIGGTLLAGGYGGVIGSLFGVLIQGLIITYITFDGTLSSWWTKIATGALLFSFIVLQKVLSRKEGHG